MGWFRKKAHPLVDRNKLPQYESQGCPKCKAKEGYIKETYVADLDVINVRCEWCGFDGYRLPADASPYYAGVKDDDEE